MLAAIQPDENDFDTQLSLLRKDVSELAESIDNGADGKTIAQEIWKRKQMGREGGEEMGSGESRGQHDGAYGQDGEWIPGTLQMGHDKVRKEGQSLGRLVDYPE